MPVHSVIALKGVILAPYIEGYAVTLWGVGISGVEGAWACLPTLLYFCLDFRQNLVKVLLA